MKIGTLGVTLYLGGLKKFLPVISKCLGGIRLNSEWRIFTRCISAFIRFAGSDVMKAIYHLKVC
jgi:hypothetical protein